MADARDLAALGALIGEPARARMLTALMSGVALTATELAGEADIAPSTASEHLARLCNANILALERQGRHRYFRIVDPSIAEMLEQLAGIAAAPPRRRYGPADPALRAARVCYDHLAGERGVWMLDRLRSRGLVDEALQPSSAGAPFFSRFGVEVASLVRERRALTRSCLDWSERRPHLGGSLGAAMLDRMFALRWVTRDGRVLSFSRSGEEAFTRLFEA